MNKKRSPRC